jgi:hypothetical protein
MVLFFWVIVLAIDNLIADYIYMQPSIFCKYKTIGKNFGIKGGVISFYFAEYFLWACARK